LALCRWPTLLLQACSSFFLRIPDPPASTLFPYTTLFRSGSVDIRDYYKFTMPGGAASNTVSVQLAFFGNGSGSDDLNPDFDVVRSEEHTSELQSLTNLVCRLLLEKKKTHRIHVEDDGDCL